MSYLRASIEGGIWKRYRELIREKTVPYQWVALNDEIPGAPKSHSLENFRIAAGRSAGNTMEWCSRTATLLKRLEAAGHLRHDEASGNGKIRLLGRGGDRPDCRSSRAAMSTPASS
jgi:DUF1680 family protein